VASPPTPEPAAAPEASRARDTLRSRERGGESR